ncbi:MAG: Hint domain-containing protein [Planktotalea sp.]|uniref:Hint domain-containing protein n=1 Tax=Planktotalea sp. TaxID=2029877 RepID=UPI003C70E25B
MPVYSLMAYSNLDLGRPSGSISTGTFTVSGASAIMQVQDDDSVFDDESTGSGETLDTSQQTLASAFDGTYSAGQVVRSVYKYTVVNNTTGETGVAYLIRVYTGTNPSSPGSQDGPYYNAFDIPVSPGDSITLSAGNYIGQIDYSELVVCFTKGTGILTKTGLRQIETLRVGDMIATRDNGYHPLRWIGSKTVRAQGAVAPIEIGKGVLDNTTKLLVSPNHRMLIEAASSDLLFGEPEVLVSAKYLCSNPGIRRVLGGTVTYIHMLFDRHEIVFADGAASESLFPGEGALNALEDQARSEVLYLFPELASTTRGAFEETARLCLRKHEALVLSNFG